MKIGPTVRLPFLLMVAILASCQTMSDVVRAKNEGAAKLYPVSGDQAWKIAMTVFRWEGADAIEEHRDEGYMVTSSSPGLATYGTLMGAWIEPITETQTQVTVVTKRRVVTNLITTLTETTFHIRFAQAVDILKAGKPLPVTPPE